LTAVARRSPSWETVLPLAGLTIIALALRLPSFGDSLWGDELSSNYVINGFGAGNVLDVTQSDQEGTPPLFFLLTWLTKGFGDTEGLRVVSLLAGLAAIPVTYLLGERTLGRPAGMVGAALVALSPFQIFYATEARAYALTMLFCLLAALTLVLATESGRTRWWVAFSLSVAAAAYTHYTSVFVLIALFGWAFLARPDARKPLLLSGLGAAVLYLPWVTSVLDDRHAPAANSLELLRPLTLSSAWEDLVDLSIGHPFIEVTDLLGSPGLWLMAAGALAGAAGIVIRWRRGDDEPPWPKASGLVLVLAVALASPVGAALFDLVGSTVWAPRNLISSWPGMALLAGALVTAGRAPLRYAAVVLLLAGFAIGALKLQDEDYLRPAYADAISYIDQNGSPDSPVVDTITLTPGPQTNLQAALAPKGEAEPERPVFTLGFATLEDHLRIRREGLPVLTPLPVASESEVAREAAAEAGTGTMFLITGGAELDQLRGIAGPFADFLNALPPRFHEIGSRAFPGFGLTGFTVHVLSGDGDDTVGPGAATGPDGGS
jgi:mannosyltransferase